VEIWKSEEHYGFDSKYFSNKEKADKYYIYKHINNGFGYPKDDEFSELLEIDDPESLISNYQYNTAIEVVVSELHEKAYKCGLVSRMLKDLGYKDGMINTVLRRLNLGFEETPIPIKEVDFWDV